MTTLDCGAMRSALGRLNVKQVIEMLQEFAILRVKWDSDPFVGKPCWSVSWACRWDNSGGLVTRDGFDSIGAVLLDAWDGMVADGLLDDEGRDQHVFEFLEGYGAL